MKHQHLSQTPKTEKKVRIMTGQSQLFSLPISEVEEFEESNPGDKEYSQYYMIPPEPCAFPELKKELDKNLLFYEGCAPADADVSMYKQLDRWKKDHMLHNSKNANDIQVLRDKHKNSLQNEDDLPKVNQEILNSILRIPSEEDDNNYKRFSNGSKSNHTQSYQENVSHSSNSSSMMNSSQRAINLLRKQQSTIFDPSIRDHNDKTNQGKKAETASLFKDSITQDSRQRLVNRKLVNNLIFSRVTKSYGEGEPTNSDKSQITNQSTSKAESLFKEEIDKFSKHTLANFKQLLHTFEKSKHIIDYEGIRQKLMVFVRQTPSILITENKTQSNDEYMIQKRGKEQRYHFKMTEQALLMNYKQINHEIERNQAKINATRRISHNLRIQLKKIEQEYRENIERAEKELALKNIGLKSQPVSKSKQLIQEHINQSPKNSSGSTSEVEQKVQVAFQQKKEQIEREVDQQETEINQDERDIKMQKQKREITRSLLKELYLSYLKNKEHSNNQSFVWIAKSLLGVDIDLVASSELFPSILDKTSIRYLSEYAGLDNTLDRLQEKLNNTVVNCNKNTGEVNKQDEFDKNYLASQHSQKIFDVKSKIKKIAMQDVLKVRRPVFVTSFGKPPQLMFEEIHQGNEVESITFSLSKVPAQKMNQIRQNQTAREEIASIQAKQQAIKEIEVNRLFDAWLSAKESKSISDLKAVLVALLGETEAEEQLKVYRQLSAGKVAFAEKNKTFTFSRQTLCAKKHQEDHKDHVSSSKVFLIEQPQMSHSKIQQEKQQKQHGASDIVTSNTSLSSEEAYFPRQQYSIPQRNQTTQFLSIPAPMAQRMREVKEKTYHLDSKRDSNLISNSFNQLLSTGRSSQYLTPNKYLTERSLQYSSEASNNSTFNLTAQEITPSSRQRNSQMSFYSPRHYSKQ